MASDLLDLLSEQARHQPLAERLRPKSIQDYLGQNAVIGEKTPLRNLLDNQQSTSLIFWGPPGVGKTTLARLIAKESNARFIELSAVSSGIQDLRKAVDSSRELLRLEQRQTVLFIDEIHRYSKTQQDALLPYVENGMLTLIGSTTENPSFQVIPALLSRLLVVKLDYLSAESIKTMLKRGQNLLKSAQIDDKAIDFIVLYANGDGRSALNLLETAYLCAPEDVGKRIITIELLEQLAQQNRLNYDRQGDEHYDHASAFQKSLRGSDANAAIYWLAKMIAAGEDPRFIARRLVITAAEDVGNAAPTALVLANAAAEAAERIGFPEARIPLAQATIYIANAKKSNQAICAIDAALNDIQHKGQSYPVPAHLKDSHYKGAESYGHGVGYLYSHDNPDTPQQFLPDELKDAKYVQ